MANPTSSSPLAHLTRVGPRMFWDLSQISRVQWRQSTPLVSVTFGHGDSKETLLIDQDEVSFLAKMLASLPEPAAAPATVMAPPPPKRPIQDVTEPATQPLTRPRYPDALDRVTYRDGSRSHDTEQYHPHLMCCNDSLRLRNEI